MRAAFALRLGTVILMSGALILVLPAGADSRVSERDVADATATIRVHIGGVGGSVRIAPTPTLLSCSQTHCAYEVQVGALVRLFATSAESGSQFVRWDGACERVRGSRCYLRPTGEQWVSALFSPVQLDLLVNGDGSLKVSPDGEACAPDVSKSCRLLDYGVQVSILARADPDAQFDGWASDCRGTDGATCRLRLTDNGQAEATFSSGGLTTIPTGRNTKFSLSLSGPGVGKVRIRSYGTEDFCSKKNEERKNCKWFIRRGSQVSLEAVGAGAAGEFLRWGGRCKEVASTTCLVANVYDSESRLPKVVAVFDS